MLLYSSFVRLHIRSNVNDGGPEHVFGVSLVAEESVPSVLRVNLVAEIAPRMLSGEGSGVVRVALDDGSPAL